MQLDTLIQDIKSGKTNLSDNKEVLAILNAPSTHQELINKILSSSVVDDNYLAVTKLLWPLIEENDKGLIKYDLYCHLLKQSIFSEKTARYICLKERELKILNTSLLGKCGTVKAVDFLMNAYNLHVNNIIEGVASCSYESQIPIMEHLLSRLNELQKNTALNKFINAYINDYPKDLTLVSFVLQQKEVWETQVLENEKIKKIQLFSVLDKKLKEKNNKDKSGKI